MLSIHVHDRDHVQDPKLLYAIRTRKGTLTGPLVVILFSKTGTMNRAFEEMGYSNVWSIDIQNQIAKSLITFLAIGKKDCRNCVNLEKLA